jgi:hypothetical protein
MFDRIALGAIGLINLETAIDRLLLELRDCMFGCFRLLVIHQLGERATRPIAHFWLWPLRLRIGYEITSRFILRPPGFSTPRSKKPLRGGPGLQRCPSLMWSGYTALRGAL